MARINTISDGQPFTYQLLNSIIEAINDIKVPEGEDADELLKIVGPGMDNAKNKPQIVFGTDTIDIPENQTAGTSDAKYSGKAAFNSNPIVLATLVDPEAGSGGIPIGYLTITSINTSGFKYRIKLIRKRAKSTTVQINYIAIGVTSA